MGLFSKTSENPILSILGLQKFFRLFFLTFFLLQGLEVNAHANCGDEPSRDAPVSQFDFTKCNSNMSFFPSPENFSDAISALNEDPDMSLIVANFKIIHSLYGPGGPCRKMELAIRKWKAEIARFEKCTEEENRKIQTTCTLATCNDTRKKLVNGQIDSGTKHIRNLRAIVKDIGNQNLKFAEVKKDLEQSTQIMSQVQSKITEAKGKSPAIVTAKLSDAHRRISNNLNLGTSEITSMKLEADKFKGEVESSISKHEARVAQLQALNQATATPNFGRPKTPNPPATRGALADAAPKSRPPEKDSSDPSALAKGLGGLAQGLAGGSSSPRGGGSSGIRAASVREPVGFDDPQGPVGQKQIDPSKFLKKSEAQKVASVAGQTQYEHGAIELSNVTTNNSDEGLKFAKSEKKEGTLTTGASVAGSGAGDTGGTGLPFSKGSEPGKDPKYLAEASGGPGNEVKPAGSGAGFLGAGKFSMDNSSDSENIKKILSDMEGNMGTDLNAAGNGAVGKPFGNGESFSGNIDPSQNSSLQGGGPGSRGLASAGYRNGVGKGKEQWGDFNQPLFDRIKGMLVIQQRQGHTSQLPKEL